MKKQELFIFVLQLIKRFNVQTLNIINVFITVCFLSGGDGKTEGSDNVALKSDLLLFTIRREITDARSKNKR